MLKSIMRLSLRDRIILFIGILLSVFVFYYINQYFTGQGMILWALVETGVMWMVIISLILLADNQRILTDEIKEILQGEIEERKTLSKISKEQLEEIKLLKKAFTKRK